MIEHLLDTNFILMADGYKTCHHKQIPENINYTYTVAVPRKYADYSNEIVAAGMHMVSSFLASVRITEEMVDEAHLEIEAQGYEFHRNGWMRIVKEFDGRLPILLMGVEEGRIIKPQTPMMAWINTEPGFAWLCGDLETVIQSVLWKMTTVASISRTIRKTLEFYAERTGTVSDVSYMLHNFGDRSADGPEAAVYAGIAHAMLFDGSDCLQANRYIKRLYNTTKSYTSSVDASEHSTMTSNSDCVAKDDWGAALMMVDQLEKVVERSKNGIGIPFISAVIDTFDDERFVSEYLGERLRDRIINSGGRMIARPDSGDPTTKPGEIGNILKDKFGYTTNDQGYNVLHPAVGVIQGDGLTVNTVENVIIGWIKAGFSLDNFCLGMGSGITHDGRRDDFSFSVKAVANIDNADKLHSLLKDPKTDSGKKSLSGLVRCKEENGELVVFDAHGMGVNPYSESEGWRIYFKDGFREYRQSFDDVRARARGQ